MSDDSLERTINAICLLKTAEDYFCCGSYEKEIEYLNNAKREVEYALAKARMELWNKNKLLGEQENSL